MNRLVGHQLAALLAATMLVAGCSGIEPYDPPDYKESPPGSGLLTGKDGQFVIYRKADEPDEDIEPNKEKEAK
jgi:hypothetical protein